MSAGTSSPSTPPPRTWPATSAQLDLKWYARYRSTTKKITTSRCPSKRSGSSFDGQRNPKSVLLVVLLLPLLLHIAGEKELVQEAQKYLKKFPHHGFACLLCGKQGRFKQTMIRHVTARHIASRHLKCYLCEGSFSTHTSRQHHYRNKHGMKLTTEDLRTMDEDHQA